MRVGYLGPAGSFSESTAQALFIDKNKTFSMYSSLDDLQTALFEEKVDMIVMPIFNSKEGMLTSNITKKTYAEMFIERKIENSSSFELVAEKFVPMNFCLLSQKGAALEQIEHVHVNPYGENLCRQFLNQYPNWQIQKHASSSAAAAALLQDPDLTYAALAAKQAAEQYGLQILAENILSINEMPVMHFLVFATTACDASSVFQSTPEVNDIYVYAVKTKDVDETARTLHGLGVLHVRKINEDTVYIEASTQLNEADFASCVCLGRYPACSEREKLQSEERLEGLCQF